MDEATEGRHGMRWIGAIWAAAALAACAPAPEVTGRALYADHCAVCHGADATGGVGPDLTGLAGRSGGRFPMVAVMDQIDGYTRTRGGVTAMPEFGVALQEGDLVMVDTGNGALTPTPERLVALAAYLRSLQD